MLKNYFKNNKHDNNNCNTVRKLENFLLLSLIINKNTQSMKSKLVSMLTLNVHAADVKPLSNKEVKAKVAGMTEEQMEQRAQEMKLRLQEIKNMDKSTLTKAERKDLKDEVKSMQKESKAMAHYGIFISLSGLAILIILLIILL